MTSCADRSSQPSYSVSAAENYDLAWLGPRHLVATGSRRLQFEPRGAMKEWRDELRAAIRQLRASPGQRLDALYTGARGPTDRYDVENVLLYNVGCAAFVHAATTHLRIAHFPQAAAPLPHRHDYRVADGDEAPLDSWRRGPLVARWVQPVPLEKLGPDTKADRVWWALRCRSSELGSRLHRQQLFGASIDLRGPGRNVAAIVKPLIDGITAALQRHEPAAGAAQPAERVAAFLDVPPAEVLRELLDEGRAQLGGERLVCIDSPTRPRFTPGDDRRVIAELQVTPAPSWSLTAEVFEAVASSPDG